MTEEPVPSRVEQRRQATIADILEVAWLLAAEHGLAGISLRELASRLRMRPQSLAWYFPNKNALYDAMHAHGHEEFLRRLDAEAEQQPLDVRRSARVFAEFCLENVPRYQLMAQRTVPGFTPSADSAALAKRAFAAWRAALADAGVRDRESVDVLTAMVKGVVDQQITVDPEGDRFLRHLDLVVDMFLGHVTTGQQP